jgi:hypothetical protein
MKYQYKMLLSPVGISQLVSSMENTEMKFIIKLPVEVESGLNEKDKVKDLESKIGTKTTDGMYEFVGYEDLVKLIK